IDFSLIRPSGWPMVRGMDRRALVGLFSGAAGLALGAAAVALGSALLGVVAAVCALAAAGLCAVVASRLRQHHGTAESLRRDILRDTLRESDTVCRLGVASFGVILEDTSEAGGVWAAERLRTALVRQRDALVRLAAGVAAYPTHALEADEVLSRARGALESARSSGSSRVEVASAD